MAFQYRDQEIHYLPRLPDQVSLEIRNHKLTLVCFMNKVTKIEWFIRWRYHFPPPCFLMSLTAQVWLLITRLIQGAAELG